MKPCEIKTFNDLCLLQTDGWHGKHHWTCFNHEQEIAIVTQDEGCKSTETIHIPKQTFDRIVTWYQKDQKERKSINYDD